MKMGEQASPEQVADLNRHKDEWEAREQSRARNEQEESAESARRESLARQRRDEERKEREEQSAHEERERVRAHNEAQARKKERHKELKKEREKYIDQNAPSTRMKTRGERADESAARVKAANRERDVRRGYDSGGKNISYDTLTPKEKEIVSDEVRQSAGQVKRSQDEYKREQTVKQKDTYYKTKSTGDQLKDLLIGKKEPWKPKEAKEVKPITTFLGGQKEKAKGMLKSGASDLFRPLAGVEAGRKRRAAKQETVRDPFEGLTASQQQQRVRRHRPREVTGFLFSEGFFNPPARAAPKKGRKGKKPRRSGGLDFDMGSMVL